MYSFGIRSYYKISASSTSAQVKIDGMRVHRQQALRKATRRGLARVLSFVIDFMTRLVHLFVLMSNQ